MAYSTYTRYTHTPLPTYTGALSNYADDSEHANQAFDACLQDSYREGGLPSSERSHTEIFLGATAGMRLLE